MVEIILFNVFLLNFLILIIFFKYDEFEIDGFEIVIELRGGV